MTDRIAKTCAMSFGIGMLISVLVVSLGSGFALGRFFPDARGVESIDAIQFFCVLGAVLLVIFAFRLLPSTRTQTISISAFCFATALAFMPAVYVCLAFMATDLSEAAGHMQYASGILVACTLLGVVGVLRASAIKRKESQSANKTPEHISEGRGRPSANAQR